MFLWVPNGSPGVSSFLARPPVGELLFVPQRQRVPPNPHNFPLESTEKIKRKRMKRMKRGDVQIISPISLPNCVCLPFFRNFLAVFNFQLKFYAFNFISICLQAVYAFGLAEGAALLPTATGLCELGLSIAGRKSCGRA